MIRLDNSCHFVLQYDIMLEILLSLQHDESSKDMKYSEIHRKLKAAGCFIVRYGKRHPIWKSPLTNRLFETSYHESEEAKPGTKKNIEINSGVKL